MGLISVDPDELRALASALGAASQDLASVSSAAGGVYVDAGAPAGGAVEQISSASTTWTAAESRLFELATGVLQRAAAFAGDAPSAAALSSVLGCCSSQGGSVGGTPVVSNPASPSAVGDAAYGGGGVDTAPPLVAGGGVDAAPLLVAGGGAGLVAAAGGNNWSAMSSSWTAGMDPGGDRSSMQGFVGSSALPSDTNPHAARANFGDGSRGMSNLLTGQGAFGLTTEAPDGTRTVVVGGDSAQGVGLISALGGGSQVRIGYDASWP